MSTCNYYSKNAKKIYVAIEEDENDFDFYDVKTDVENVGRENFPYKDDSWNEQMDARNICLGENYREFSNYLFGLSFTRRICARSGYYQGINLDYEIKVSDCYGGEYYLSEYDDVDDLAEDIVNQIEESMDWFGYRNKWNKGLLKMQRKNIIKHFAQFIENEVDICEDVCDKCSEMKLRVVGRFSNGGAVYEKIG